MPVFHSTDCGKKIVLYIPRITIALLQLATTYHKNEPRPSSLERILRKTTVKN